MSREKNARLVGSVLRHAADYGDYPCHRVVSASASSSLHQTAYVPFETHSTYKSRQTWNPCVGCMRYACTRSF
ncbi:MGMT family protein [Eikenella corrodens]|uniref:MGMT family protein n=1 Tax=Eikenella corrodens TaxID=539 RepID=UPI001F02F19D|nr:MGMT family protein [Eikenella corrodens]